MATTPTSGVCRLERLLLRAIDDGGFLFGSTTLSRSTTVLRSTTVARAVERAERREALRASKASGEAASQRGRETYRARDEERRSERSESTSTARGWGGVRHTLATVSFGVCVTAVIVVRWKPSTRSRSLTGIFSLGHPHRTALARIGPAQATTGFAREPVSPFQSARNAICGVGYRTFHVETALYFCG